MTSKRALVVDDSRAARQVLTRMLESCGLEVESAESAELALNLLQSSRPNVIFMDHLMPGMDGLAAVRLLKSNPTTANIPVLMYTSQEGPEYLNQARGVGAVGVLSKTLKQGDVTAVLQRLHLMPADVLQPAAQATLVTSTAKDNSPVLAELLSGLSARQLVQRIVTEVNAELARNAGSSTSWLLRGAVGLLVCVLLALIYSDYQLQRQVHQLQQQQLVAEQLAATTSATAIVHGDNHAVDVATSSSTIADGTAASNDAAATRVIRHEVAAVPYGEVPLAGSRLDSLRAMVDVLRVQSAKVALRVEVFTGDFCLHGNATDGYHVAADDSSIKQCDLLGNPFADVLNVQQRQSTAFTNFLTSINQTASNVRIQLADGGRQLLEPYPAQSEALKAGEWNRSAERNNRVEFTVSTNE